MLARGTRRCFLALVVVRQQDRGGFAAVASARTISQTIREETNMDSIESRSDSKRRLLAASPAEIFAAISDPTRIARWWGPAGFSNTIHTFDFIPGGSWLLTMHGPDGKNHPNESRFVRIIADQLFEIEHLNGHHFLLTIELVPTAGGTEVSWRQTFDSADHYRGIANFIATANEQNLDRLAAEVQRVQNADQRVD